MANQNKKASAKKRPYSYVSGDPKCEQDEPLSNWQWEGYEDSPLERGCAGMCCGGGVLTGMVNNTPLHPSQEGNRTAPALRNPFPTSHTLSTCSPLERVWVRLPVVYGLLVFLLTLCAGAIAPAAAQTQSQNYVITQAPRISGLTNDSLMAAQNVYKSNVQISIQYVDGLGRPVQTVQKQGSPKGYDLIMPQVYDQYGREVYKYLPYAPETGTAGTFRSTAIADQASFYTSPPTGSDFTAITDPFAQTAFDNSPLNRTVEQGAPGPDWQLGSHTVKMVYTVNNATSFATDSVNGRQAAMYYTVINSDFSQTLHANGYYLAGTLTVTIAKDENWSSGRAGTVEEYKDIDGHVVLKRQYNYVNSAVQVLSTYYVYDDLGRLAFVLPPTTGADEAITMTTALLNNLCYQYRYDERGRPEAKRLPGKGFGTLFIM